MRLSARGADGTGAPRVAEPVAASDTREADEKPAPIDGPQAAEQLAAPRTKSAPSASKPTGEAVEPAMATNTAGDPATFVRNIDVLQASGTTTPDFDVPPPSSGGPCPKATTCKTHVVRNARLPSDETGRVAVPWKFNDEGRRNLRAPQGLLESAMRWATAEWSRWNSNLAFAYAGTTTTTFGADGSDGSCDDGTNTVTWHQFDPEVIAAVVTCTDPKGKTVRDVDLALNVTQHWEDIRGEADSRHTFDIRSIVTHEIGHWVSLLDLYDGDSVAQTMMGNAVYGETRKRTLALGDVVGIQTAYPCGDGDSCPRSGIVED